MCCVAAARWYAVCYKRAVAARVVSLQLRAITDSSYGIRSMRTAADHQLIRSRLCAGNTDGVACASCLTGIVQRHRIACIGIGDYQVKSAGDAYRRRGKIDYNGLAAVIWWIGQIPHVRPGVCVPVVRAWNGLGHRLTAPGYTANNWRSSRQAVYCNDQNPDTVRRQIRNRKRLADRI